MPAIAPLFSCLRQLLAALLLLCLLLPAHAADDFLPPEQAFRISAQVQHDRTVRIEWQIADGYYLYQERLQASSETPGVLLGTPLWPKGEDKFDPNFDKTMVIYHHQTWLDVPVQQAQGPLRLSVGYQGCAQAGLCYPPTTALFELQLKAFGGTTDRISLVSGSANFGTGSAALPAVSAIASVSTTKSQIVSVPPASTATDSIASTLASGSLLQTLGVFWLAGLLLSFTPCVLPMVPILSSLIAGHGIQVTRRKGFLLSLSYALGMALVYAAFGVAAGLAGEGLAAALQNPWVLGSFALLLCVLALSMFGVYELQLPGWLQSRATELANRLPGGSFLGVFLMGGISALVVGPCVAAPLAGALVYISQTRNVLLGGSALFAMALGMSVPLLLVGLSAGSLLPRVGAWMERIKHLFGMALIGVAIWLLAPVLPITVQMLLWSAFLLAAATLLGLFKAAGHGHGLARGSGFGAAALALVLLLGAASGGQSVLQPLAHLRPTAAAAPTSHALAFTRIASVQALDAAVQQASAQGRAVMLDFYADWCVSCKEFESFTFSDAAVQQRLAKVVLLQADVTANNAQDKALLKRFGLFGPPGIVFFSASGEEQSAHKVIGFQNATDFLASLERAWGRG